MGLETPLWRALAVFRVASWAYAVVLMARGFRTYPHPMIGWTVLAVMAAWTIAAILWSTTASRRAWTLLVADFAVTAGCLLASMWVIGQERLAFGADTVPMAWVAGPVVAWGLARGRLQAALAALAMGTVDAVTRGVANAVVLNDTVLLLMAGMIVGHAARLAAVSEANIQRVAELEAANRERERIARGIHDSVLQVLTLVHRRGVELGGDAAELGRLAGEQEAALRSLVATEFSTVDGEADLRALVNPYAGDAVTVAAPATPVVLPGGVAGEVAAAVASALDNVRAHAGPGARLRADRGRAGRGDRDRARRRGRHGSRPAGRGGRRRPARRGPVHPRPRPRPRRRGDHHQRARRRHGGRDPYPAPEPRVVACRGWATVCG
ncbi:DUF5931 domain-containing protein [Luedemannella helvata]|uniref:DUF5931 domain-containing protein n=1 Tax=Luedemannella helvata TaxID=349315 RepID=A0ABP4WNL3_9ACTN